LCSNGKLTESNAEGYWVINSTLPLPPVWEILDMDLTQWPIAKLCRSPGRRKNASLPLHVDWKAGDDGSTGAIPL